MPDEYHIVKNKGVVGIDYHAEWVMVGIDYHADE